MVPEMSSIISVMEEIEINNPIIIEIKERAKQKLTNSIEAIRQLSHDLMPETLNKQGLIFSLRDFLGQKSGKKLQSILPIILMILPLKMKWLFTYIKSPKN